MMMSRRDRDESNFDEGLENENEQEPGRRKRPKTRKDVKLGLGVIVLLVVALGGAVAWRMMRSPQQPAGDAVAAADKEKTSAATSDSKASLALTPPSTTVVTPQRTPPSTFKPVASESPWGAPAKTPNTSFMPSTLNAPGTATTSSDPQQSPSPPSLISPTAPTPRDDAGLATTSSSGNPMRPGAGPLVAPPEPGRYAASSGYPVGSAQQPSGYSPGMRYGSGMAHDGGLRTPSAAAEPAMTVRRTSASGARDDGTYKIQPNDTYWAISEKVYGTGGYFKALVELNRDKVEQADRLQVGAVISTPPAAELEKKFPGLCPKASHRRGPAGRVATVSTSGIRGGKLYVVEAGDTLFDIAKHELGRADRWSEIYDLNRDKIGEDLDYLVPGTKLVLPPGAAGGGESVARQPESPRLR